MGISANNEGIRQPGRSAGGQGRPWLHSLPLEDTKVHPWPPAQLFSKAMVGKGTVYASSTSLQPLWAPGREGRGPPWERSATARLGSDPVRVPLASGFNVAPVSKGSLSPLTHFIKDWKGPCSGIPRGREGQKGSLGCRQGQHVDGHPESCGWAGKSACAPSFLLPEEMASHSLGHPGFSHRLCTNS